MSKSPAYEIHAPHQALVERDGRSEQVASPPWIKVNVTMRDGLLAKLKGARLSVFLCVGLHIDEDCQAHPSIETIAEETGYDRKTVMRAVKWLEANGQLSVERFPPGSGQLGRKASKYTVLGVIAYGKRALKNHGPKMSPWSQNHGPSGAQTMVAPVVPEVEPEKQNQQAEPEAFPIDEADVVAVLEKTKDWRQSKSRRAAFSRRTAEDLCRQFGRQAVLDTIGAARERADLRNPAGWVIRTLEAGGAVPTSRPIGVRMMNGPEAWSG